MTGSNPTPNIAPALAPEGKRLVDSDKVGKIAEASSASVNRNATATGDIDGKDFPKTGMSFPETGNEARTQLTEAGQKLADALVKADLTCPRSITVDAAALNTAAQILLTPEGGGGLREAVTNLRAKMAESDKFTDEAENGGGWWGYVHRAATEIALLEKAVVAAALAPKTCVLGNDAGMREAIARLAYDFERGVYENWTYREFADAILSALSPPTGSAGDDETGVRSRHEEAGIRAGVIDPEDAHHHRAALTAQPPKAETPAGVGERCPVCEDQFCVDHGCAKGYPRNALSPAPAARAGDGVGREIATLLSDKKPSIESSGDFVGVTFDLSGEARQFAHLLARAALTAAPAANGEGA